MTIGTNRRGELPEDRATALLDAATLEEEAAREGSPLFGRIDVDRIGVGGWSWVRRDNSPRSRTRTWTWCWLCPWKPGTRSTTPFR